MEIRWTWADGSLVRRELEKASPFHWTSSPFALDTISQLERQSLKDQRRPVCMIFRGQELRFANVKQAVAFLTPTADHDRVAEAKQRQPWENIESLIDDATSPQKKRVRGALHCTAGHSIQKRSESSSWWFEKRACQVCETTIGSHSAHWHCTSGCNYKVCNHCFQTAVWSATQLFAEKLPESHPEESEASTSEGPESHGSSSEGPHVELKVQAGVQAGSRQELWPFDARPLDIQLVELNEALGLSSRHSSKPIFLVRSSGSDIEIVHSKQQLQSLVPHTLVIMESADVLVSTYLDALAKTCAPEVSNNLRCLLGLVCNSEVLADEAFEQGALSVLTDVIRLGGSATDLACVGICTFLMRADRRTQAMATLRDTWHELGNSLIYQLLVQLFPREKQQNPAASVSSPNATLTFFLWLLEDIVGAASTAHAVSQGGLEADGASIVNYMYPSMVHFAQGLSGEDFQAHAGRLVLCTMLRASTHQVAQPDLLQDIRQEIESHATTSGALAWLEELVLEHGFTELLGILTESSASPAALELQLRQREADQMADEKKFNGSLQSLLRQKHNTLREMVPFVRLDDVDMEKRLDSVVRYGWASQDWVEGYTLLHQLCEYPCDTRVIRLVAGLCTDLDARDGKGNRPIDYALQNQHTEVAQCLLEVQRDRVATGLCLSHLNQGPCPISIKGSVPDSTSQAQPQETISSIVSNPSVRLPSVCLEDRFEAESPTATTITSLDSDGPKEQSGEATAKSKGPCPDTPNVGIVFMLRTQLTSATRENDNLRDKVAELEQLRTRNAIITEEVQTLRDRCSLDSDAPGHSKVKSSGRSQLAGPVSPRARSPECASENGPGSATLAASSRPSSKSPSVKNPSAKSPSTKSPSAKSPSAQSPSAKSPSAKSPSAKSPSGKSPSAKSPCAKSPVTPKVSGSKTPRSVVPPPKGKGKGKGKMPPKPPSASTDTPTKMQDQGKGKGKGRPSGATPTKPTLAPSKDLKSIPWTRFVKGAQIEEGTTIWDEVNKIYDMERHMDLVPVDEIERRFSKAPVDLAPKVEKVEKKESKKSKVVKLDSISQDQRFQIEVCLRTLPLSVNTGGKAVIAIRDLNKATLSAEAVNTLHRFLCPSEEQCQELALKRQLFEQELEKKRAEDGEDVKPEPFQLDPVEQYMEDLSQVSGCSMRLSCWGFLYNLPDRVNQLRDNLDRFEQMVHCFRTSQELPSLLGLVLAFGNYLNGGKNEKRLGQADGFHIEMLGRPGGLDVVNDSQGRNVRQLIFSSFFSKFPEKAERLMLELLPMFSLVQRRIVKNSDGTPDLKKSVRVQIEELDKQLLALKHEFCAKHKELKEGLQLIEDPADKFVVEIPEEFEREKKRVEELVDRKDLVLQQFKALIAMYKAETYRGDAIVENGRMKDGNPKEPMTSEVWCKIWDDFFVVPRLILGFDEKKQKEIMEPRFCKDALVSVESLKIMWRLQDPKPTNSKKKGLGARLGHRHSV